MTRFATAVFSIVFPATIVFAGKADVAVVKCTIAVGGSRGKATTHVTAVTRKLDQCGVAFDLLTDEQVIAGKLSGYKLAIFPYNSVMQEDEVARSSSLSKAAGSLCGSTDTPRPSERCSALGNALTEAQSTQASSTP